MEKEAKTSNKQCEQMQKTKGEQHRPLQNTGVN